MKYNPNIKLPNFVVPITKEYFNSLSNAKKAQFITELAMWEFWNRNRTPEQLMRSMMNMNEAHDAVVAINSRNQAEGLDARKWMPGWAHPLDLCVSFYTGLDGDDKGGQRGFVQFGGKTSCIVNKDPQVAPEFKVEIKELLPDFNINDMGYIKVAYCEEDGKFYVVDGHHRLFCAIAYGYIAIPVLFIKLKNHAEMNELFKEQDKHKAKMRKMQLLMAGLNSVNNEVEQIVNNSFADNGITLCVTTPNDPGITKYCKNISRLPKLVKDRGTDCLDTALRLFNEIWPDYKGEIFSSWISGASLVTPYRGVPVIMTKVKNALKEFTTYEAFNAEMSKRKFSGSHNNVREAMKFFEDVIEKAKEEVFQ